MFNRTPRERTPRPHPHEQPPFDYERRPQRIVQFSPPQPPLAIEPKPLPAVPEPQPQPTW